MSINNINSGQTYIELDKKESLTEAPPNENLEASVTQRINNVLFGSYALAELITLIEINRKASASQYFNCYNYESVRELKEVKLIDDLYKENIKKLREYQSSDKRVFIDMHYGSQYDLMDRENQKIIDTINKVNGCIYFFNPYAGRCLTSYIGLLNGTFAHAKRALEPSGRFVLVTSVKHMIYSTVTQDQIVQLAKKNSLQLESALNGKYFYKHTKLKHLKNDNTLNVDTSNPFVNPAAHKKHKILIFKRDDIENSDLDPENTHIESLKRWSSYYHPDKGKVLSPKIKKLVSHNSPIKRKLVFSDDLSDIISKGLSKKQKSA